MIRNSRRGVLGIFYLVYQLLFLIKRLTLVSFLTVFVQIIIYLKLVKLPWTSIGEVCISYNSIINDKYHGYRWWQRLVFSSFEHVDDWHLYYNILSFVNKASALEKKFGRKKLFVIILFFSVLANVMYIMIAYSADHLLGTPNYYTSQCAVGFSGVIFGLKVLTTHYCRDQIGDDNWITSLFGSSITSASWYVWIELFSIHIFVPHSSFIGHLSGIIIGILYIHGPVGTVIDALSGGPPVGIMHQNQRRPYAYPNVPGGYCDDNFRQQPSFYQPEIHPGEQQQIDEAIRASLQENYYRHENGHSRLSICTYLAYAAIFFCIYLYVYVIPDGFNVKFSR